MGTWCVPEDFGARRSPWKRHRLRSTDGTYERMLQAVRDSPPPDDPAVMALLPVDSTGVRAHRHAAGARFSGPEVLTGGSSE